MSFCRLLILAFALSSAAGCERHLRADPASHLNEHARELQSALGAEDDYACGSTAPSLEQRFDMATMVNQWQTHGRKLTTANITVPVYFWHTFSPGSTPDQILTYDMIKEQHFATLQAGYRDTPFQFELKDIQLVESAVYGKCERLDPSEYAMKRELRAPGKNVLNIYICDSAASDSRAWSSTPIQADIEPLYDGVVIRNPLLVAPKKQINAIMNIVHETGECLL
jgi:hypothetical protein